jgi:hypothetical protein
MFTVRLALEPPISDRSTQKNRSPEGSLTNRSPKRRIVCLVENGRILSGNQLPE